VSADPIDRAVWRWEDAVWEAAGALDSPQLDEAEARLLLADLWARYRRLGRPMYLHTPRLIIDPRLPGAGVARYDAHSITVRPSECRAPILMHECGHLLTPGAEHGPGWIEVMLALWEAELRVPRSIALQAGRQMAA